jgi:hypothetical protein
VKFPRLPRAALGLVLTWLGISLALGWRQRQQVLDEFSASAMGFVAGLQADIGETQTVGQQDALLLARSPSAHAVAAGNTEAIPELEALFVAYARSRSDVFQVRYLDRDGLERARIEHTPAGAAPVRDLQDKSDRYYFREATAVADGDV